MKKLIMIVMCALAIGCAGPTAPQDLDAAKALQHQRVENLKHPTHLIW